jgi:hypothetical protein
MDIKLSMFFLLIAAVIAMSGLNRGNLLRMKRGFDRQIVARVSPRRRQS